MISLPKGIDVEGRSLLDELLSRAEADTLRALVWNIIYSTGPTVWKDCLQFLRERDGALTGEEEILIAGEEALLLWSELDPDLCDMDTYGGAHPETEERVAGQLYELAEHLDRGHVSAEVRMDLQDRVMEYIESRNSGMDDYLYGLAYATCYDDADLVHLAGRFEGLDSWARRHAMNAYRHLGQDDDYLRLRLSRLEYGNDYHDLAVFHWERGEREKALDVAWEGLEKGKGGLNDLRAFLGERALETGDRSGYLKLKFDGVASHRLTVDGYRTMRELCTDEEWAEYEPRLLALLSEAVDGNRIDIHLERGEYPQAIQILVEQHYVPEYFGSSRLERAAAMLVDRYPEEIIRFYETGLRHLGTTAPRKTYAVQAQVLHKVRDVLVNILRQEERWVKMGRRIKEENRTKPAFQEEFARAIPDWDQL